MKAPEKIDIIEQLKKKRAEQQRLGKVLDILKRKVTEARYIRMSDDCRLIGPDEADCPSDVSFSYTEDAKISIYLGNEEYHHLFHDPRIMMYVNISRDTLAPHKFMGAEVFRVNATNHLKVFVAT